MKRIVVLLMALLIVFALVGCNIAPNVPRVSPYVTDPGAYYNVPNDNIPYGNRTGTYKNPATSPLVRSGVNPADKVILPGAGTR